MNSCQSDSFSMPKNNPRTSGLDTLISTQTRMNPPFNKAFIQTSISTVDPLLRQYLELNPYHNNQKED